MTVMDDSKKKQYKEFQKLDEEWRSEWLGKTTEQVYDEIGRVAINDVQLAMAKEFDEDLKKLKEQVKVASEPYSEGHKDNKIRIKFLVACLKDRGENVPSIEDFMRAAANSVNGEMENA